METADKNDTSWLWVIGTLLLSSLIWAMLCFAWLDEKPSKENKDVKVN